MNHLIQITVFILLLLFSGCQKNSTLIETPVVVEDHVFTLPENSPSGTLIGQVKATTDAISGLNFNLVSGINSQAFEMETSTGRLLLKDSSLINYEAINHFELEVMVRYDNCNKDFGVFAKVFVQIEDIKEKYSWQNNEYSTQDRAALIYSLQPDSNLAHNGYLFASAWTTNYKPFKTRSFLEFDLADIASDVHITGATLSLYNPKDGVINHKHSSFSGSNAFYVRRVLSKWNYQTINWNNQPAYSPDDEVKMPASLSAEQDFEKIDVLELVRSMVRYPEENYGFVIMLESENYYRRVCFASFDYPDANLRPKLEINYLK